MSAAPPLPFRWTGDSFVPVGRFAKECDARFVIGQTYRLDEINERSASSHNHEFAWLGDAWTQLPERIADLFPSPEHLRKAALIDAGFYQETILDAGTNAAALRVAALMRSDDQFARVVVRGPLVVRRTAKSQSRRAMNKEEFQRSKDALIEVVSAMIGVTPDALRQNAGKAA